MFPLTHAIHILPSTYADSRLCRGAHNFVLYPVLASFEIEIEFKFLICRHSLDSNCIGGYWGEMVKSFGTRKVIQVGRLKAFCQEQFLISKCSHDFFFNDEELNPLDIYHEKCEHLLGTCDFGC